jgi:uncharacterized protein YecE (DUF72 family)
VEINNTFYHQPKDNTYDHWRDQAPKGFLYAIKANRYITHLKRLNDPEEPLERFFSGVCRLKEHLGPILFQLPPNWNPNLERLEQFFECLPQERQHVVEFRNRDWLREETYELMKSYGISLCVHDMLHRHPRRLTGPILYLRFHGSGRIYGGRYRQRSLVSWAEWIREAARDHDVFAYFNNDEEGHAVEDAQRLREMLS